MNALDNNSINGTSSSSNSNNNGGMGTGIGGTTMIESQARFAVDLLRESMVATAESPQPPGSLIISPISVAIALAMVYAGARDKTALQLAQLISTGNLNSNKYSIDEETKKIHNFFGALLNQISDIDNSKNYTLKSANRIYVQNDYPILDAYKELLQENYHGQFQAINFLNSVPAAKEINAFVDASTGGKIQELVSPSSFGVLTKLVLVNAVYFKGTWSERFNPELTRTQTFHIAAADAEGSASKKEVQMMHKKSNKFVYYENADVQVLGIPYKNAEAYMFVVLPKERFGLSTLIQSKKLDGKTLSEWTQKRFKTEVDVQLPKFKLESELKLNDALERLGLHDAFSDSANFSGITSDPRGLKISDAIQKARIEMGEEGTEATAATAIRLVLRTTASQTPELPPSFVADHPFLYCVVTDAGHLLFIGVIGD